MKLKDFLQSKDITQAELAKATQIDPSRISNFVNGVVAIPKRHYPKFIGLLGITLNDFLDLIGEKEKRNRTRI